MKKIISIVAGIVIAVGAIIGATINSNAQDKTMTDVKIIDDFSYEIIYADGEKTIHTFDTELECAEEYSNTWYEIYE